MCGAVRRTPVAVCVLLFAARVARVLGRRDAVVGQVLLSLLALLVQKYKCLQLRRCVQRTAGTCRMHAWQCHDSRCSHAT